LKYYGTHKKLKWVKKDKLGNRVTWYKATPIRFAWHSLVKVMTYNPLPRLQKCSQESTKIHGEEFVGYLISMDSTKID
jgi:hypothetical protein